MSPPQAKLATSDSQAAPKTYLGDHSFGSLCTFSVPAYKTHTTPANAQHIEPNPSCQTQQSRWVPRHSLLSVSCQNNASSEQLSPGESVKERKGGEGPSGRKEKESMSPRHICEATRQHWKGSWGLSSGLSRHRGEIKTFREGSDRPKVTQQVQARAREQGWGSFYCLEPLRMPGQKRTA